MKAIFKMDKDLPFNEKGTSELIIVVDSDDPLEKLILAKATKDSYRSNDDGLKSLYLTVYSKDEIDNFILNRVKEKAALETEKEQDEEQLFVKEKDKEKEK